MSVFRVEKTKNYTVMSNYHLKDRSLSLKTKGLLSIMLSLPDDWDYTISGLCKITGEGHDSIRTALRQLEQFGYLKRNRLRDANGRVGGTEYVIYETPEQNPDPPMSDFPTQVNPTQEKPTLDEPTQEKPTQLNTNDKNNLKNKDGDVPPQEYCEQLIKIWNATDTVIEIKGITPNSEREKNVNEFMKHYSLYDVKNAAKKIENSDYLRKKRVRFDWFLRNIDKILEGNYDDGFNGKNGKTPDGKFQQRGYDYKELEKKLMNKF